MTPHVAPLNIFRHECRDGVWVGIAVLPREQLPDARRLLVSEGPWIDVRIHPTARGVVRLYPELILECEGVGVDWLDPATGRTVFPQYVFTIRYGRR